jgi:UDP-N-acetylglucosamine 3-dehydrogenase
MSKLGVAVIGTGFWGKNHARVYKELSSTELVAICDVNAERAKAVAEQFGAQAYTDSAQMLKDKSIEAVSVCTWSTFLAEEAHKALSAGKHVLVEKPMATNSKQAKDLYKLSQQNGLHLTVGFLTRFIPGVQVVREAIEKKQVGDLVCATSKRVNPWPERIGDVGVVKDSAIHDIDVMRFISRQDPVTVYAKMGSRRIKKYEDYAHIMLTYENGESAFIEANWLTPSKTRLLTVTGSEGIMKLDYITQELWIEQQTQTVQPRQPTAEPLKLELDHFAKCVTEKQKPLITGMDGIKALQIAEAAMQSSAKNTAIKMEK